MKKAKHRTFRPTQQNQERLELADRIGLNISELINEMLDKHFKALMETKAKTIHQALSQPVP